jgi:uncharacterized membrane protein
MNNGRGSVMLMAIGLWPLRMLPGAYRFARKRQYNTRKRKVSEDFREQ